MMNIARMKLQVAEMQEIIELVDEQQEIIEEQARKIDMLYEVLGESGISIEDVMEDPFEF